MLRLGLSRLRHGVRRLVQQRPLSSASSRPPWIALCTGQYGQYGEDGETRAIALRWPATGLPETLLDEVVTADRLAALADELGPPGLVRQGEMNFLGSSDWTCGVASDIDRVCIFDERQVRVSLDARGLARDDALVVPAASAESIFLRIEEGSHVLGARTLDGASVELLRQEPLADVDLFDIPPDAATMLLAQFAVKSAGLLVLRLRQLTARPVRLLLPPVLTERGNTWVQQRNQAWREAAQQTRKKQ